MPSALHVAFKTFPPEEPAPSRVIPASADLPGHAPHRLPGAALEHVAVVGPWGMTDWRCPCTLEGQAALGRVRCRCFGDQPTDDPYVGVAVGIRGAVIRGSAMARRSSLTTPGTHPHPSWSAHRPQCPNHFQRSYASKSICTYLLTCCKETDEGRRRAPPVVSASRYRESVCGGAGGAGGSAGPPRFHHGQRDEPQA
jgi:hypothetical protein